MRILHTESSSGWGGQEIRILKEAEGMRLRGHEIIIAVAKGGGLASKARAQGFTVYEIPFKKTSACKALFQLMHILCKHRIDLINTHSSLDAWLGGIAGRCMRKKILRTRHLSTPIRKGLNSKLLYKTLCDFVVTTSSGIIPMITDQANLAADFCRCIPTGVDLSSICVDSEEAETFRRQIGVSPEDCLVGTACFVRSWKGIDDFLKAAHLLKEVKNLKWVVVGGGHVKDYIGKAKALGLDGILTFTGHLDHPYPAIQAMDLFALLSTAHEGISQASLQAAYLQRPLITTTIGGLAEVCLNGVTGVHVPTFSPEKVAEAVLKLKDSPQLRKQLGENGKRLVEKKFTLEHMLQQMEEVYQLLFAIKKHHHRSTDDKDNSPDESEH